MPSAGTPEVGVTALGGAILQVPGSKIWRSYARGPARLRWKPHSEEPKVSELALVRQPSGAPTLEHQTQNPRFPESWRWCARHPAPLRRNTLRTQDSRDLALVRQFASAPTLEGRLPSQ